MTRKRPTLADLKAEVWSELKRGESIIESELHESGPGRCQWKYYGLCVDDQKGNRVYVNPQPSIIETVVHELIHRNHPRMSERTVNRKAMSILRQMSHAEIRRWVKRYKAVAVRRRKPTHVDAA